ncbi:MAG: ATP synthase F1 subunit delta [Phycisphaerales bacterium]|nr:ATP synthase F1 subunit delta [Phycisphaerales bacterium]
MAVSLDSLMEFAGVYATALFDLARERGNIDTVRGELDELVKLADQTPEFDAFLNSDALDDDHRAAGLERMFRGKLSDEVLNTLQVLNRNGRNGLLRALARCFALQQQEAAGQVEVFATTAVELSDDEKSSVTKVAADKTGKWPIMHFRVNPDILGGLILQVGDIRYDNSVRSQLNEARERLAIRSEVGLPVAAAD